MIEEFQNLFNKYNNDSNFNNNLCEIKQIINKHNKETEFNQINKISREKLVTIINNCDNFSNEIKNELLTLVDKIKIVRNVYESINGDCFYTDIEYYDVKYELNDMTFGYSYYYSNSGVLKIHLTFEPLFDVDVQFICGNEPSYDHDNFDVLKFGEFYNNEMHLKRFID